MTTLVTGALGCIGAWTVKHLVEQDQPVVSFDLAAKGHRIDALMTTEEQTKVTFVVGDLRDFDTVLNTFKEYGITKIIHLAALQVPFCRADPVKGAQVNVVGTVNIFEAAKQSGVRHIAQASSIAVYGAPDDYDEQILGSEAKMQPRTLYGVYKQADEGIARVYWNDYQLSSVALRPFTVYGVGRDQGLTSDPTKAMLHAVAGKPFHIGFGGKMQMQLASDTALQFIAASNAQIAGAMGFNMGGNIVSVEEIVHMIREEVPDAQITHESKSLPFPEGFDDSDLKKYLPHTETPLRDGISRTVAHFKKLLAESRVQL